MRTPITDPQDIRLNESQDLEAIIGHPPGWSLRWGMSVLFGSVLLLVGIAWFVSYPDIVEAPVLLTTQNPPIRLAAGASGKLVSLRTSNGAVVKKNDLIAVLENPANTEDVLLLENLIAGLADADPVSFLAIDLPKGIRIGSLHVDYARFSKNFEDFQYFLKQEINFQKIANLQRQIAELEKLGHSLGKQINLFEAEIVLSQNGVRRDSLLFSTGSLSQLDFENTKALHLSKSRQLERLRSELTSNKLDIQQLQAQILDLRQKQSDSQNDRILAIKSDLQNLAGALAAWKQKWMITAPIDGEVVLTTAWSEQQFVKENEEVLTIVPTAENDGGVLAKAQLGNQVASGKVVVGMVAQIRLTGFPYQEYGVLNGRVARLSKVPGKDGFEAEIELPDGMKTSYNKPLAFQQEMTGTARIITEDRNLLLRVLEKIRAAFER